MTKSDGLSVTALFFDLDGTLSDYVRGVGHALEAVWNGVADRLAPREEPDFLESYWRNFDQLEQSARRGEITTVEAGSRKGRFARILREFGLDHDSVLIDEMSDLYTQGRLRGARLFPGVRETLAALREEYSIGVVTEGNGRLQRQQIRRLGLEGLLDHIIVSEEAGLHKPDPAIYHYALAAAGAGPRESVMVGDRIDWDLAPARQVGMHTALFTVNNRYLSLRNEMEFKPDWEIGDFVELLRVFLPAETV